MFVTIVLKTFYKSSKVYIEDSFSSLIPPIFKVHKKNIKFAKSTVISKIVPFSTNRRNWVLAYDQYQTQQTT